MEVYFALFSQANMEATWLQGAIGDTGTDRESGREDISS